MGAGLYYLKSRFCDSKIGRFICADGLDYLDPHTVGGLSLFAYCGNNPVMGYDPTGRWTYSSSLSFSAFLIGGATYTVSFVFDMHGNIAIQTSKADIFREESGGTFGTASIGISASETITRLETVYDLEGVGSTIGGAVSLGEIPVSIGGEIMPATDDSVIPAGVSVVVGMGLSHRVTAYAYALETETRADMNIISIATSIWTSFKTWIGVGK